MENILILTLGQECITLANLEKHVPQTLPEAQRTQGIESITSEIFFSLSYFKLIQSEPDGAICIGYKFGHQMVLHTLFVNLATRWCYLHQL